MTKTTTLLRTKEKLYEELYKVRARKSFKDFVTYTYEGYSYAMVSQMRMRLPRRFIQGGY